MPFGGGGGGGGGGGVGCISEGLEGNMPHPFGHHTPTLKSKGHGVAPVSPGERQLRQPVPHPQFMSLLGGKGNLLKGLGARPPTPQTVSPATA